MIDFACTCGHQFSVDQDMAGGLIQCPRCRKLNDVPQLGELANLDEGGIYKIEDAPPEHEPGRLERLTLSFTRDHLDAQGNEIDLRTTLDDVRRAGGEEVPLELADQLRPAPPKYDPVTGELIRPIDVIPDTRPDPATLPVAQRAPAPPRPRADGIEAPSPLEVFAIPFRLLRPINLLVMLFILLAHGLGQFMMAAIASFYLILIPFWAALHAMIVAHYGNVIDETGPTSRNELPTPLRQLDWHDDTVGPMVRMFGALALCYGPAGLMLLNHGRVPAQFYLPVAGALAVAGTIALPAAALTMCTSGSIVNMRPDRLLGVILACGVEYLLPVMTWVAGGAIYLAGIVLVNGIGAAALNPRMRPLLPQVPWYLDYTLLGVGIYLMHFMCWHLGTLYRKHHERFPWLMQRYVSDRHPAPPAEGFPVARGRRKR